MKSYLMISFFHTFDEMSFEYLETILFVSNVERQISMKIKFLFQNQSLWSFW